MISFECKFENGFFSFLSVESCQKKVVETIGVPVWFGIEEGLVKFQIVVFDVEMFKFGAACVIVFSCRPVSGQLIQIGGYTKGPALTGPFSSFL
jgi:hypothetical protein